MIIIARGGGEEDIIAIFNHTLITNSIRNSQKPIITAIGHASNQTFSNLVAYDTSIISSEGIRNIIDKILFKTRCYFRIDAKIHI
ncbi:exodeoxyribonuclease VII large subunit ['Camptotheca acuminata' phytoplasma]|uniref:exodeoxyribonuclease VII large subunit n=1 Tax='Camptotheca acuminata' phytoplasma TaxID=3239192 RepID=UPI00351A58FC